MELDYKHYGKTIDKLSKKETELLILDMELSLIGKQVNEKVNPDGSLDGIIRTAAAKAVFISLMKKRVEVVFDILNVKTNLVSFSDMEDYIEKTIYSFDKFIDDVETNIKNKKEVKRLALLN